jgi:hypothetical protein
MRGARKSVTLLLLGAMLLSAGAAVPSGAQTPSLDDLLRRAVAPKPSDLYTLNADFNVLLAVRYGGGGLLTAAADGRLKEWHGPGEPLHRSLAIRNMRLPAILRPFTKVIQQTIRDRIEKQPDDLPDFHAHDFFLLDDADGRYTIGGIRRDIVTQTMAAYTPAGRSRPDDLEARRTVAKWLFTSPLMRSRVVRSGPPYALEGVVDAQGLLRAFTLFYNWGNLHTEIDYAVIDGAPVWNRLRSDVATALPAVGPVAGQVTIALSNECLDCAAGEQGGFEITGRSVEGGPPGSDGRRPPSVSSSGLPAGPYGNRKARDIPGLFCPPE